MDKMKAAGSASGKLNALHHGTRLICGERLKTMPRVAARESLNRWLLCRHWSRPPIARVATGERRPRTGSCSGPACRAKRRAAWLCSAESGKTRWSWLDLKLVKWSVNRYFHSVCVAAMD